jgi:hypothetical protein
MIVRRCRFRMRTGTRLILALTLGVPGLARPSAGAPPAQDQISANSPLPPQESTRRIKLPDGFTVTLFAAEPDVVQPIAMTIDHKGRLWVVENYSYPIWLGGPRGKDRILIF